MITKGFMIQSYLPHTVSMAPLNSLELIDPRMNPPFDALSVDTLGRGYLAECSSENRPRQKVNDASLVIPLYWVSVFHKEHLHSVKLGFFLYLIIHLGWQFQTHQEISVQLPIMYLASKAHIVNINEKKNICISGNATET